MNRNSVILVAALTVAVFLAGFVPSCVRARRAEKDAAQLRREARLCNLSSEVGRAFLQASLKNYGLAGEAAARFFDDAQSLRAAPDFQSLRPKLEALLARREEVMAALARGDAAAFAMLQNLYAELPATPR